MPSECPPCLTADCLDGCILNQTIGCENLYPLSNDRNRSSSLLEAAKQG